MHQLFIDFKKAYDSVRREVLHNILIEFGIPMKLVRLIKVCLPETYSRVRLGKNLSDRFPINPYPTAFPYGNGMVLHFYQQQESSTTKTVHKVINKGLKAYV